MANKKVDVAIVGVGWVGGIIAAELTKAGLKVVGLERGHDRSTAQFQDDHDELRYAIRYELFQNTANETWTLRHNLQRDRPPDPSARRLPAGHRDRRRGRPLERPDLALPSARLHDQDEHDRPLRRSGDPANMTIQDWGITYDELEPYYDKFEYMAGIAGKAGNLKGQQIAGGNVFEGPRSREFPVKPPPDTPVMARCSAGDEEPRLPPVHRADREPADDVQEPGRDRARPVHLLRVLRALRLRGRREGRPDSRP